MSSIEEEPMEPPPSYNEAVNLSTPIVSQPVQTYPTTAPYPVTDSTMPLPVTSTPNVPYPIEEIGIPLPSTRVPSADSSPSYNNQSPTDSSSTRRIRFIVAERSSASLEPNNLESDSRCCKFCVIFFSSCACACCACWFLA